MALFKRKRQYQEQNIQSETSLTNKNVDAGYEGKRVEEEHTQQVPPHEPIYPHHNNEEVYHHPPAPQQPQHYDDRYHHDMSHNRGPQRHGQAYDYLGGTVRMRENPSDEYYREAKRTKMSHEDLSNNIVFEDDLLDGYGPDLYGDEEDRRYLNSLSEFERENILMQRHERRQEIQRKISRLKREGRLRERKQDQGDGTGLNNSSLNELRQRRMEQREKRKKEEESIQSQIKRRQADYDRSYETVHEQEEVYHEPQREIRVPPLLELLHITLTKNAIQVWMNQPYFQDTVLNCFIKFYDANNENVFRFGEIVEVDECEPYYFGGRNCTQCLVIIIGDNEERVLFNQLSNEPITQSDYSSWVQNSYTSQTPENRFPTPESIMEKAKRLQEVQVESHSELLRLKLQSRKYTINDSFPTLTKAIAECRIEISQMDSDDPEKEKKEKLLQELTAIMEEKSRSFYTDKKVRINEKILQKNLESKPQKAPKKPVDKTVRPGDPFSRIESQGTSMYIVGAKNPEFKVEEPAPPVEKPKEVEKKKIDPNAIASAHDFDLGIDIDDLGPL